MRKTSKILECAFLLTLFYSQAQHHVRRLAKKKTLFYSFIQQVISALLTVAIALGAALSVNVPKVHACYTWQVVQRVGLKGGAEIRTGSGLGYPVHTIVPNDNWQVDVIGGPRYADGQEWWDTSWQNLGGGGTGWVYKAQASPGRLVLIQDLSVSSTNPTVGEQVSASYRVKNIGGQAITLDYLGVQGRLDGDINGTARDFYWVENLTLQPDQEYTYSSSRDFDIAGNWRLRPNYKPQGGDWSDAHRENGTINEVWITVQNLPSPGRLVLIQDLSVSSTNPTVGEQVSASYRVKNIGGQAITLDYLGVQGRLDGDINGTARDFYWVENLTLQPGQEYTYSSSRDFDIAGSWRLRPNYKPQGGDWGDVHRENGTINEVWITVQNPPPPGNIYVASGLELQPDPNHDWPPVEGDKLIGRFTLGNNGGQTVHLEGYGVRMRRDGWDNWDFLYPGGGADLAPGQTIRFDQNNGRPLATGHYQAEITWKVSGQDWQVSDAQEFDVTIPDIISPAAITNLNASTGSTAGTVHLSWTAPGDDGNTGTASTYIVRYADSAIGSELGWAAATDVDGEPTPQVAGSAEGMAVSGLTPRQTYYFAIRSQDEVPNLSGLSNSPSAVAGDGDTTPPAAVTDLTASTGGNPGQVDLNWTAPGDDGNTGTATTYIVRYRDTAITTEFGWLLATDVSGEPTPQPAGSSESMTVSGLTPGQTYYFAIKTQDEVPNTSGLSNSPSAMAGDDTTPPAAITDLAASTGNTAGTVDLSWTAPGDDGNTGTASTYIVRYADSAIAPGFGWLMATDVDGEPTPQVAGSSESMTVSDLTPGQTYYFAVKTQDEVANTSELSNSPNATAKESPVWTLMFYVDGDNNLDDNYVAAFNQLESAADNSDVNILVAWDRSANGNSAYYEVQHDTDLDEADPAADYTDDVNRWPKNELRMNGTATLSDFIQWARTNYPAPHYALIICDHGTGLNGLATDDGSGGDWLRVTEWSSALATATSDGMDKIDVVFADVCLMAMIEDAYQIRNYTDYYLASENLIWITGGATSGPYDDYISSIEATTSPRDLATIFVNRYAGWLNADRSALPYTISAADLGQLDSLVSAVNTLASNLNTQMSTYGSQLANARVAMQKFDSNANHAIDQNDAYVDLYDFAQNVMSNIPDATIQNAAQGVMDAIQNCVIAEAHHTGSYNGTTWNLDDSHGVSVFFPPNASSFYNSTNYDFAVGATWPGSQSALIKTQASEVEWGPMLVTYCNVTQPGGPDTPEPPSLVSPLVPERGSDIYLPIILKAAASPAPDLIVERITATSNNVEVVIKNVGDAPATDELWVDVYFNPTETPAINHPWDTIADHGVVWGVTTNIEVGDVLTLTTGGDYYFPEYSSTPPLPVGADVYALVDSINYDTTYGAVRESNEDNNLFGPVTSTASVAGEAPPVGHQGQPPSTEGLPPRR